MSSTRPRSYLRGGRGMRALRSSSRSGRADRHEYSKLVSTVVSLFTANYIHGWPTFFPDNPLQPPLPNFDGRAVCYPGVQNLRDYMSWRQVDCNSTLYDTHSSLACAKSLLRSHKQPIQYHFLGPRPNWRPRSQGCNGGPLCMWRVTLLCRAEPRC